MRGARILALVLLAALAAPERAAAALRPEEALSHVGEEVTVEGEVATVVCSPLACLLSFTTDFSGLVASIPGEEAARFPPIKETYAARRVRVQGTIVERSGRPRMELLDPAQIRVVDGEDAPAAVPAAQPPARAAGSFASDAPARAGTGAPDEGALAGSSAPPERALVREPPPPDGSSSRVVSTRTFDSRTGRSESRGRLPGAEGSVAALGAVGGDGVAFEARALREQITRLEESNRALAERVAVLEERILVLEQTSQAAVHGVVPPPFPETPPYVVPGQSSKRVQHVKRGWSSERVLRALGPPLNATAEANGYTTWYYSNGRALTLDPRGRVSSSVGF